MIYSFIGPQADETGSFKVFDESEARRIKECVICFGIATHIKVKPSHTILYTL